MAPGYGQNGMRDLIDERDRKAKMSRTLVKGYNVLYLTKEQAEELERKKEEERLEAERLETERMEAEQKAEKEKEEAAKPKDKKKFNAATGSYSGEYGQGEVSDMAKRMLEELQSERNAIFDSVVSSAKS